jgi:peptidyl-prolyl cis-trans isomerase A (cyclophilin A)
MLKNTSLLRKLSFVAGFVFLVSSGSLRARAEDKATPHKAKSPKGETAIIKVKSEDGKIAGAITLKLLKEKAPKTVENFVGLATGKKEWTDPTTGKKVKKPLYNGTVFHRVIPDFMIQGGDPLGNGTGGPGFQFEDEFAPSDAFDRPYILAMANAGPGTNGSQFFITVKPTPWLNQHHTIFGEVTDGQKVVDQIVSAPRGPNDMPNAKIKIESSQIK